MLNGIIAAVLLVLIVTALVVVAGSVVFILAVLDARGEQP